MRYYSSEANDCFEIAPRFGILIGAHGLLGDIEGGACDSVEGVRVSGRRGCSLHLYALEAAATRESSVSNERHALGEGDGGEAAAIIESLVSNARHALGEGDGGEAAATIESTPSNARHAFGDGDTS